MVLTMPTEHFFEQLHSKKTQTKKAGAAQRFMRVLKDPPNTHGRRTCTHADSRTCLERYV